MHPKETTPILDYEKYHFLVFFTGKWMVMVDEHDADKMWQTLCEVLLEMKFPECITSIKINLYDDRHKGDTLEKINVITRDFTKVNEVREAEAAIFEHNPTDCIRVMKYKADLYTHVNIFRNNKFGGAVGGIAPSMYVSNHINRAATPSATRRRNRVPNPGRG